MTDKVVAAPVRAPALLVLSDEEVALAAAATAATAAAAAALAAAATAAVPAQPGAVKH